MLRTRRCFICKTRLSGKKGHGFVSADGKTVICGDFRRHRRLKKGHRYEYGKETETQEAEAEISLASSGSEGSASSIYALVRL